MEEQLLRHEILSTTSALYGGLSLEAKRQASERLVEYVKHAAKAESMQKTKSLRGYRRVWSERLSAPDRLSPHFKG